MIPALDVAAADGWCEIAGRGLLATFRRSPFGADPRALAGATVRIGGVVYRVRAVEVHPLGGDHYPERAGFGLLLTRT